MGKKLSVFIDESGDVGMYQPHSPYYIVTLVFHNQEEDMTESIKLLNKQLANIGCGDMAIHTEPLVRREGAYVNLHPNERRGILAKLYFFAVKAPISFKTFLYDKRQHNDAGRLESRMTRDISMFVKEHMSFFQGFDKIILYYDNGQSVINRLINTALVAELPNCEIRKVYPHEYRLFQVADLICTLKLIKTKLDSGMMSKSEKLLFHSRKDFYRDFIRRIENKEI